MENGTLFEHQTISFLKTSFIYYSENNAPVIETVNIVNVFAAL
jgi:hypothetical protein